MGGSNAAIRIPGSSPKGPLVPARVRSIGALNAISYGAQNGSSVLIGPLMTRAEELNLGEMAGSSVCAFRSRVTDGRDGYVGVRG